MSASAQASVSVEDLQSRLAAAEARAEAAERRLGEVLDAFPEGVVILDHEGRYVRWNRRYAEIYHRSADLLAPGRRLIDALRVGIARGDYPDALGREEAWLAERAAKLAKPDDRHEQRLSDGRWLLIEERRLSDGGVVGLRIDITEMKRQAFELETAVSEAHRASAAKSEFLANISHEIRTPLHGVLGMADILLRDPLETRQRQRVELIARSGRALLALLNDLLDLSKIEAGQLSIVCEPFDVAETLEAACAPFALIAAEKGVRLTTGDCVRRAVWRHGDALRVGQIISNLASNAVKFTSAGEVKIFLEDGPDEVRVTVQDDGPGVPVSRMGELFQKFSQIESAPTRRFGGTGLGLAVCRELADLMGGRITVASAPGHGSCFSIALPLPRCEPAAPLETEDEAILGGVRILAAEDNPTNQIILRELLAPLGVELTLVEDGAAAVETAVSGTYDVVLMDIQMPVLDGVEATLEIRRRETAMGRTPVPVVALSANVMEHQTSAYREAGMNDVCGKPISAAQLIRAIADAMR